MASTKRPVYKVETKPVSERKRRKSDLVIMWQSIRDVTSILLKELWMTALRIWELLEIWFSSSERFQVQTWLEKHLSYVPDDFSDSWRDGRLLGILLSKLQPGCFPEALQLDPNCPLQNVYKALNVLELYFGIIPNITAEEMVTCAEGSDTKLFDLLLQLKQLSESPQAVETVSPPETSTAEENDPVVNKSCVAKGTGLAVGFVGRMSTFIVFFAKLSDLDIVVDIRGPTTSCSEKITRRSPKKKRATVQWDLRRPFGRSVSYGDSPLSCQPSAGVGEDRLIPLEYEIFGSQVTLSYKPKEKGFHRLAILWHGQHVSDSPYSVYIEDVAELVGAESLTHLKKALKSAKESEATTDTAIRFGKPVIKVAPDKRKFGKVLSRRVICYVVKVNGQDIPVSAESTESLASELLKMDCEGFEWVPPCFHRRNSWGFAGDATRKRSVIRQFGVDPKELELQSSQRRTRSLSVNPASEKLVLERNGSCDSLPTALNVVEEDALENADDPGPSVASHDDAAGRGTEDPSFERPDGNGEDEGYYVEEDGDSSCKSLFEDRPCNETSQDSGAGSIDRLDQEHSADHHAATDRDSDSASKSVHSESTSVSLDSDAKHTVFEDIILKVRRAGFQESSSTNNVRNMQTRTVKLDETTENCRDLENSRVLAENSFPRSDERIDDGHRLVGESELKQAESANSRENVKNITINECVESAERGLDFKFNQENKTSQERYLIGRSFQSNQAAKDTEIHDCVSLNFAIKEQARGKNHENFELQLKSKIVPMNRYILPETKSELIKVSEVASLPEKGFENKAVWCNINDCSSADFASLGDLSVENDGNDFFQNIEKHTEKKVTKPSANHLQEARDASEHISNMNVPAEKKTPLKSHILKPLVQFNFKQFNPSLRFQTPTGPVKGQIELWERALTAEERTGASKGTRTAEIDEGNVRDKLAFWENNLRKRREPCASSSPNCQTSHQPESSANPAPNRTSLDLPGEASRTANEQASPVHFQTYTVAMSGCEQLSKTRTSNLEFEQSVLKNAENAELGAVPGGHPNQSNGNINEKDGARNISVKSTPDKHTARNLNLSQRNHPSHATHRSFSDPGLFESTLDERERLTTASPCSNSPKRPSTSPSSNSPKRSTASPCSNSSKRPTVSPYFNSTNRPTASSPCSNSPNRPTASLCSNSSNREHSSTSIDDNFEWDGFSTGSDDESDAICHESSGGEFIDDEITGKAATEYWGDLQGLRGLCRPVVDGLAAWEEEMFMSRLQKVKSHPELCVVFGIAAYYGHVSVKNTFEVYTGDAGFGTLSASVQGYGQDDVTMVIVRRARNCVYEVTYQVMTAGYYLISIRWLDQDIPGSPFVCKVTY